MLKELNLDERAGKNAHGEIKDLGDRLASLLRRARPLQIPVVIELEGWSAAGKGRVLSGIVERLDPRGYRVYAATGSETDDCYPPMRRHHLSAPSGGQLSLISGGWWGEWVEMKFAKEVDWTRVKARRSETGRFERMLLDDGAVLIKLFLHISEKEQRRRFESLEDRKATRWRVTKADWAQHEHYDDYLEAFEEMLSDCPDPRAPWVAMPAHDDELAVTLALRTACAQLEDAIERRQAMAPAPSAPEVEEPKALPIAPLREVDLAKRLSRDEYERRLKAGQRRLRALQDRLYQRRVPLIVALEGWDAAGKGGAIRKLCAKLDPRGVDVVPIGPPTPEEASHNFLWRFWRALPQDGRIAVFDRTWYGRVLVERVEALASEQDWSRAYREIAGFERSLIDHGAVLVKCFLHIDPEEQYRRFNARLDDPDKRWKITDEDWRNRAKWARYEVAIDEMLARTNTAYAPWTVVEANDKRYARVKLIDTVADAIEETLDE